MIQFVDGLVVLMCTFAAFFFAAQQHYIIAIFALIVGIAAYNHLAGQYRDK